jgi:hypothetical protein
MVLGGRGVRPRQPEGTADGVAWVESESSEQCSLPSLSADRAEPQRGSTSKPKVAKRTLGIGHHHAMNQSRSDDMRAGLLI